MSKLKKLIQNHLSTSNVLVITFTDLKKPSKYSIKTKKGKQNRETTKPLSN